MQIFGNQRQIYLLVLCVVSYSAAAPGPPNLDVRTTAGTFRGVSTPANTEKWLGIPFAEQPVGKLRFRAPKPIASPAKGIQVASTFGNACPQPPSATLGAPIGEDCLHLNVWRPQGVKSNAKLPVLFWIHGGAWTTKAASEAAFDPTIIIQQSVQRGKPIIFVSTNYRMNTFGFLASKDVPLQDLNVGLQDQRQALNFVQDNIAAFGGDPNKVTIWGQSAGAGSVEAHILYPAARTLFRAGIADSSTGPFKSSPPPEVYDKPGKPFSRLLSATGCSPGPGAVACLQNVPFPTLMNITNDLINETLNGQLWEPTIAPGSFAPVPASQKVDSGNFLHVPYIGGTNINEGTIFAPSVENLRLPSVAAQTEAFQNFVGHLVIDNSTITPDVLLEFDRLYPANDPAEGAPFNTGDSLFDRAAAWYTDQMFLSVRRHFFDHASSLQPMYAYYFGEFIPGNDIKAGVAHQSELELLFGPIPEVASIENDFAATYRDFYINFVNDLNPGPEWPPYSTKTRKVLQLIRDNITLIPDDFNIVQTNFINTQRVQNEFAK
ncbi:alpha/beta-hydrolase [Panaeolus papilionaceus]|nr:alpha/beta-hydrolase [Panaeolus papilionaceus]